MYKLFVTTSTVSWMWLSSGPVVCIMHVSLQIRSLITFLKMEKYHSAQDRLSKEKTPIPVFLTGDPAYPLMPYLRKEYAAGGSNRQEQYLGYRLYSAHDIIQCSFGCLRARFACLECAVDINIHYMSFVIYACFVLHNFREISNESIGTDKVRNTIEYDRDFQPPQATNRYITKANEAEGKRVRQALTKCFDP